MQSITKLLTQTSDELSARDCRGRGFLLGRPVYTDTFHRTETNCDKK